MSYSDIEYVIFARQLILKEFSEEAITKLGNEKISIIGLGGIGCPLSKYLISSGIKNLTIIDGDKIEKSNLNRQILYNVDETGEYKADVSKSKLLKTNPYSIIKAWSKNIDSNNIDLLSESSIVIDTTDSWKVTKLINEYCVNNSKKFIFSSAIGHDVQVCLFNNNINQHICLNCLYPNKEDVELPRCETVGISGIAAGMAGLITAQKTINSVLNLGNENNFLTFFNVINAELQNIEVKNNKGCLLNKC